MIGNAHLDPVWLWPWQEGYQEARATFWSAIHRMEEYPDFIFTCDQIVLLSWVEESDPELFEQIRRRVAEGRWVNVGGWWVEPDNNMPMGESFVRQGLYGQRYLESRFGVPATVGMNVDPFGHNAMLPQILRGQGMDSYTFLRPGPHESDLVQSLFWWEAPDGSRVLAYRIPFEYGSPPGSVDGQTEKSLAALDRTVGFGENATAMVFYGVGNHGGGPTIANIESIHRYDRMGSFGRMTMSSPRTYFDEVLGRGEAFLGRSPGAPRRPAAPRAGMLFGALGHQGVAAPRAVRRAERRALGGRRRRDRRRRLPARAAGDRLEAGAVQPVPRHPARLGDRAVLRRRARPARRGRRDLEADHHPRPQRHRPPGADRPARTAPSRSSSSTRTPGRCRRMSTSSTARSAAACTWSTRTARPVVFQNSQSTATTDDVLARRGRVPRRGPRAGLPPLPAASGRRARGAARGALDGHRRHARERPRPHPDRPGDRLDLAPTCVKATGVDVMAGIDGTQHTQINEDPTDTWGHRVISYAWPGASMALKRIVVRETGPLRSRVRVEREWGASTLVEELILDHDSPRPARRRHARLAGAGAPAEAALPDRAGRPDGDLRDPVRAPASGRSTARRSRRSRGWTSTGTVDGAPAGLTVITTNKHGYDVSPASDENGGQPSIGVTAVRSPVYSWHDPRLLDPEGIYSFQDQGVQRFSYELVPHAGDWRTADPIRRALVLGNPVRAMQESFHDGALPPVHSFAGDGGGAVMVTALKGTRGCVRRARRRGRGGARGRDARRGRPVADRAPPARPHDRGGLRALAAPHLRRAGRPGASPCGRST